MVQHLNVPALKKQWVLDAQWTDCPEEIEMGGVIDEGQDESVVEIEVEQWFWGKTEEEKRGWVVAPVNLKPLIDYIRAAGIPDDEEIIIHWWW